jgi:geranylgeranyl reductase family protein
MAEPQRAADNRSAIVHADVGIIGAGPAGLATAVHLGQIGIGRVVIVDRADFPRDKTCGSAVSPKGCALLKALGVSEAVTRESYTISGLRLVTPRGHDVVMSSPQDAALICNRRTLDHLLLQRAQECGARFLGNFEASHLLQRGDRVVGFRSADGREVRAEYVVVADGAHTRLARERGPRRLIQAIMGWWDGVPFHSHNIEMIFDNLVAPYYGWLFPEGPGRVNIGICYEDESLERNARQLFQSFLDKHYRERLSAARQVGSWKGHPISFATSFARLTSPGRIVVGEAGRMTHPATAEGIYQGMRSGMLAAQTLSDILKQRSKPERAFREYERACRKAFGVSFRSARLWKGLVMSGGLDVAVGMMNRPTSRRLLARCMAQM